MNKVAKLLLRRRVTVPSGGILLVALLVFIPFDEVSVGPRHIERAVCVALLAVLIVPEVLLVRSLLRRSRKR